MFKSEFLTMTSTTYSYFDSQLFFKSHLYILAHSFFFSLALPHPPPTSCFFFSFPTSVIRVKDTHLGTLSTEVKQGEGH